jgi:hypothetical protein
MSDEFGDTASGETPAWPLPNMGWLGVLLCSASAVTMLAMVGLVTARVAGPGDQTAAATTTGDLPMLTTASGRDPGCRR